MDLDKIESKYLFLTLDSFTKEQLVEILGGALLAIHKGNHNAVLEWLKQAKQEF